MWQGQPYGAELQQAGCAGVKYPARDVDVGDGVAVEEQASVLR